MTPKAAEFWEISLMLGWRPPLQHPLLHLPALLLEEAIHENKTCHLSMFFLSFQWLRAHHVTCKKLPKDKCCAKNNILLMHYKLLKTSTLLCEMIIWQISSLSCQRVIQFLLLIKRTVIKINDNYWTWLKQKFNIVICLLYYLPQLRIIIIIIINFIDLLPTDKTWYSAQLCCIIIIVNYEE